MPRRIKKNYTRATGVRRESFCPLDKDLSWKSRNRISGCARFHLSGQRRQLGLAD